MGWLSSLNKDRKRSPAHKFISKHLFKGAHVGPEREDDLQAEHKSMNDYVLHGPQEGGRTYTQEELREGPAYTLKNSVGDDLGQVHGSTGEYVFEGMGKNAYADELYEPIDIPEGSWLANQMKGTLGSNPSPAFGQYTPPPTLAPSTPTRSALDFSGGNPFAQYAKKIGFSDYQNAQPQLNSPTPLFTMAGKKASPSRGTANQAAMATALRGGNA